MKTIDDLIDAFNSGLVKVGLRTGALDVSGSSVAVSNVPHVVVDTMPTVTVAAHALTAGAATIGTVNVGTMPTVTVAAHALTAGAATIGTVNVTGYPAAAATADAVSNPTETRMGADGYKFNGTSWDRARGASLSLTTGDSGAKTATGNGATMTNIGNKGIQIMAMVGAMTGTAPTIAFQLQVSTDGGTNWTNVPGGVTATLTASGVAALMVHPGCITVAGTATSTAIVNAALPRAWRLAWVLGGTTPNVTITAISYQYLAL